MSMEQALFSHTCSFSLEAYGNPELAPHWELLCAQHRCVQVCPGIADTEPGDWWAHDTPPINTAFPGCCEGDKHRVRAPWGADACPGGATRDDAQPAWQRGRERARRDLPWPEGPPGMTAARAQTASGAWQVAGQ